MKNKLEIFINDLLTATFHDLAVEPADHGKRLSLQLDIRGTGADLIAVNQPFEFRAAGAALLSGSIESVRTLADRLELVLRVHPIFEYTDRSSS